MAIPTMALFLMLTMVIGTGNLYQFAEGGKRRIRVTDDLDDVIDDEEDDSWREWGKKKSTTPDFDPPPEDFSELDPSKMQEEILKLQLGSVFGFVKLQLLGFPRTSDMVSEIAIRWTKIAGTGGIEAKFMAVDRSTIMFTMEKGQDVIELKEFLLSQPDAYEVKLGDQLFRRPGDAPFEQVFNIYQSQKNRVGAGSSGEHDDL